MYVNNIKENQFVKIPEEDIWYYKKDCFSGILYSSKIGDEVFYNIDIFAKEILIESISVHNFEEAQIAIKSAIDSWIELSG